MPEKPLGQKAYTSILHLPGSNRNGDRAINEGQARILTERPRPGDEILVFEKLDGTNVAVAKTDGQIVPLIRAGYRAEHSNYEHHYLFADWVMKRYALFDELLEEDERICGEWLAKTHSIPYDLTGLEPFVGFDLIRNSYDYALFDEVRERFLKTRQLHWAPLLKRSRDGVSVEEAMRLLDTYGYYGAREPVEGAVWRVETDGCVEFMAKYVRPDFEPGKYLDENRWNWKSKDHNKTTSYET